MESLEPNLDQKNLAEYRQWYEVTHADRETETRRLELLLDDVEAELEEWEETLEWERQTEERRQFETRWGEVPNPHQLETKRYYQGLWRWKWDIERQLRNLIRAERDDLEWLDKLEGRQRARERAMGRRKSEPGEVTNEQRRPSLPPARAGSGKNRQHKKTSHRAKTDV